MNKGNRLRIPILTSMFVLVLCVNFSIADPDSSQAAAYQQYREAIEKEYGIDINNFSDTLKGAEQTPRA